MKGKVSPVPYIVGVVVSRWAPEIAQAIYVAMALIWLIPDRRIENALRRK